MVILVVFDSAPESIKKSILRSGDRKSFLFGLSKRSGTVHIFLGYLYFICCVLIYILFALELPLCSGKYKSRDFESDY